MTDPRRLSDDANAPAQLRALLRSAPSAHPLDPAVRERARARALRAAAFPVTAVGWLSVKTAVAALSIGCGTAVVAVIASTPRPVPPPSSKTPANRNAVPNSMGNSPAFRIVSGGGSGMVGLMGALSEFGGTKGCAEELVAMPNISAQRTRPAQICQTIRMTTSLSPCRLHPSVSVRFLAYTIEERSNAGFP